MSIEDDVQRLKVIQLDAANAATKTTVSIDGAALLERVYKFLGRFVAYPSIHARVAHTLWTAHCHCMEAWVSTPRLAFLSPEPASGKSRALEVTELLVPRPIQSINATAAYLFRKVSDPCGLPTVLFDEIDTLFGPRAKDHEELRGLLNAGHRRGATACRCVMRGKDVATEELPAYCAVALAGLGKLPDTILTRSVVVRMRRRGPGERVEPFRHRDEVAAGLELRDQLAEWTASILDELSNARPVMPQWLSDRPADVWEPLLAVADAASEEWSSRARTASEVLVTEAQTMGASLGVRLLGDLYGIFEDRSEMSTPSILKALLRIDEAPWNEYRGRGLTDQGLADLLRDYGIRSKKWRSGTDFIRGYRRCDFVDSWARYLEPKSAFSAISAKAATSATAATTSVSASRNGEFVAAVADVAGFRRKSDGEALLADEP